MNPGKDTTPRQQIEERYLKDAYTLELLFSECFSPACECHNAAPAGRRRARTEVARSEVAQCPLERQ